MLPRRHRLRRSADIQRVQREGGRWRHPLVMMAASANDLTVSRFAVVAGKPVGSAVIRNRAKRRMRESLRFHLQDIASGWDCVLVARKDIGSARFSEIDEALLTLLARAKLLHRGVRNGVERTRSEP